MFSAYNGTWLSLAKFNIGAYSSTSKRHKSYQFDCDKNSFNVNSPLTQESNVGWLARGSISKPIAM